MTERELNGKKPEKTMAATLRICEQSIANLVHRRAAALVPKRPDEKKADLEALRSLLHLLQKRGINQS